MTREALEPRAQVSHLQPEIWAHVNRHLVAKAIGEYAHELAIEPQLLSSGQYALVAGEARYHFRARRYALDHWSVDSSSLSRTLSGRAADIDALSLIVELREQLGIPGDALAGYLEQIASTLYAAAYVRSTRRLPAAELARADFQALESGMQEGHPVFVANNGRVGFNVHDQRAYAPENAAPISLVWLAASKQHADFACVGDHSYPTLISEELGARAVELFAERLARLGHYADDYVYLPVHPWQWRNRIQQLYAADLARGDLVYLGTGEDTYQAQQSIRTLFNRSQPHKRYVKTSLSILNMGFTRGMSASAAASWAAANDWVSELVHGDAYLRRLGCGVLREVAFAGYRHRIYERAIARKSDAYKELLAALWRESPTRRAQPGQRLMTMAALLHVDRDGRALLPALIEASQLDAEEWLQRYLRAYLTPLLHCFYAYHLTFTPHCENVILVLERHAPVGMLLKDLAEDIGVLNPEVPLPDAVRRLGLRVPEDVMTLVIFTDVFDCVFRLLAPLLEEHAGVPEQRFWRLVADCILDYEREQPAFAAKYRRYDLFAPQFTRNCLNRLQLRNHRMMVDLNAADPVTSLQLVGTLQNPIAGMRR